MAIKLFAIDMDGTCLNTKSRISEETLTWLYRAKEQGVEIVPTTGRTLSCIPYQLKETKLFRYVITSNGAVVTDMESGKPIFNALMPLESALALMRDCEGPGLGMTAHIGNQYLLQGRILAMMGRLQYGKDAASSQTVRRLISYTEATRMDVEELQLFFFTKNARRRIEMALEKHKELAAAYSDLYVEIYSQNASKGTALAAVAKQLSLDREELACIGDGENDLSMFHEAGLRFAMGNAVPALKAVADRTVSSNDENGVAQAIRHLLGCS